MKKIALIAGVALLASCGSKTDTAAEPSATESAAATTAAVAAPSPAPGVYDVTDADGKTGTSALMADNSFVDRDGAGKVIDKGTWAVKDGKTCFTGEGKAEECWTESARDAAGGFTATGPKGEIVQVKPHAK